MAESLELVFDVDLLRVVFPQNTSITSKQAIVTNKPAFFFIPFFCNEFFWCAFLRFLIFTLYHLLFNDSLISEETKKGTLEMSFFY